MTDNKTCQQCGTPVFGDGMKSLAGVFVCSDSCAIENNVATGAAGECVKPEPQASILDEAPGDE